MAINNNEDTATKMDPISVLIVKHGECIAVCQLTEIYCVCKRKSRSVILKTSYPVLLLCHDINNSIELYMYYA